MKPTNQKLVMTSIEPDGENSENKNSDLVTEQTHNIIKKGNDYFLDRKLISIHSEDRDTQKWAHENEFEVILPEKMVNVHSMRLMDTALPDKINNIHHNYKNTKLAWRINPSHISSNEPDKPTLQIKYLSNEPFTLTIQNGYYDPEVLATTIQTYMRYIVSSYVKNNSNIPTNYSYTYIYVIYNKTTDKFDFICNRDKLELVFDYEFEFVGCTNKNNVFKQSEKWGLPYMFGFNKQTYKDNDLQTLSDKIYPNEGETIVIEPAKTSYHSYDTIQYISAPFKQRLFSDNVIYVELDKYNTLDEIKPYVSHTTDTYDNDYNGVINSAFAKIILGRERGYILNHAGGSTINNINVFKTVVPTIGKLKFKFRYHDGRNVEFDGQPIHLMVEINQLIDDNNVEYNIRQAPFYGY